jgi:PKD repeat protein
VKKIYASLAALAVVVSGIALFGFLTTNSEATPTDCDNNAIVKCGSTSYKDLADDYKKNKSELSKIYGHYGLSESEILNASSKAQMGRVYKDGTVKVGSKVVATNAYSIGRENFGNSKKISIGGKTYYERKTSTSFVVDSISAFVFFDANGDFKAAILTACGNPVRATKPVYKCDSLTKTAVTGYRNRYQLVAKASAKNGAKIVSYTFDMGDGTKKTATTSNTSANYTHQYTKPGTYTATVSVKVKINNSYEKTVTNNCKVSVTVVEPSYACTGLTKESISRTENKFTASATAANGAVVTGYKFDFGDGTTETSTNKTINHTYAQAGEYTAKVTAIVTIDGKETKEVTDAKCQVKVTVDEEPVYTCDDLAFERIENSRTKFTFTGTASADHGATITGYTIDFGDGTTAEVANATDVPHEYATPGEYTVKMTAKVSVNGQNTTVTGENCEVKVTVTPPNKVEVCNPETGETIVVDEDEADNYVPVGDPACEPVKVCDPATGKIITVDKKDEGNYKPIGDPACEKPEECKPGIPVNDERCKDECKPGIPEGDEKCEELPAELPTTGPAEMIGGVVGLGSLVAAAYYWYASRRGLTSELLNR